MLTRIWKKTLQLIKDERAWFKFRLEKNRRALRWGI